MSNLDELVKIYLTIRSEREMPELFEARIHQGNFKDFMSEHASEGLPPGVNVMREFTITVRKPTSKV